MQKQTPLMANCSQCSRSFPVRAQMQLEGKSLPMLVVPSQVDSVEAALEQATCQVCLKKTGPADRGLHKILEAFGFKDEDEAQPPREAVVIRPALEVPRLTLPVRTRGLRHDDWRSPPSEPRLPRALREPERHEPLPKVAPLTGAIRESGGNAAVLEVAMKAAKVRDEAKRLERAEKFEKILFWLRLALARIRKNAAKSEVWDLAETFQRKLGEAASLDASQRGKKGILKALGISETELEALCFQFYLGKEPIRIRWPVEIVEMDAFEGGRRPESWDAKGGRKPAFYQFEVVRIKNSLPVPNPPLPGGDEDKIDALCAEIILLYKCWLAHDEIGIGTELAKIDLPAHLPAFFENLKQALAEEAAELAAEEAGQVEVVGQSTESTTTSPELPVTT